METFIKENVSELISGNFKNDTEVKDWRDPFDSLWLKLITVVVYILEVMASMVMFTFVRYETQGFAGHYRTIINQFLSYLYGAVSLLFCIRFFNIQLKIHLF